MAKSLSTDTILIGAAIAWSLALPFFPTTLFELLDSLVGAFLLLFVVLLALPYGPVPGVLVFVAVALTFAERNRRKIQRKILSAEVPDLKQQLAPAPPMSPDEVHPVFDYPEYNEDQFQPEENATNDFHPVGSSINDKMPIATIDSNSNTASKFYQNEHLGATTLQG